MKTLIWLLSITALISSIACSSKSDDEIKVDKEECDQQALKYINSLNLGGVGIAQTYSSADHCAYNVSTENQVYHIVCDTNKSCFVESDPA